MPSITTTKTITITVVEDEKPVINANDKKLSVDNDNYFYFTDDALAVKIAAGGNAKIVFTSPMVGKGTFDLAKTLVSGNAEFKLTQGTKTLFDWTSTLHETTEISAQKSDVFTLEIRTENGAEVNVINGVTLNGNSVPISNKKACNYMCRL